MDQIRGHRKALGVLTSALQSGRMPHAWVFHGPVGVGKFKTANWLAGILLCKTAGSSGGSPVACGVCGSCRLLQNRDQGGHPDLHIVRKELARYSDDARTRDRKLASIPVEVLREYFLDPVYRAPQIGSNKVVIVDEAELLSESGQNLLLKTLEEPPSGTFIILVAGDSASLLPTVRSRCRMLQFGPLTADEVGAWIREQSFDLADDEITWLGGFSGGSPGRAKLAVDYGLRAWDLEVRAGLDAIRRGCYPAGLGAALGKRIGEFSDAWVKADKNASKDAANKLGAGFALSLFAHHARRAFAALARDAGDDPAAGLEARVTPWLDTVDALKRVEGEIRAGVNLGLALDHLVSLVYRSLSGGRRTVAAGH